MPRAICSGTRTVVSSTRDAGSAAVRAKQHADAKRLAGSGFAFFEPRTFNAEGFSAWNAFDPESDAVHLRGFERIDEKARKNILHCEGDGKAVGRKRIARSESIFNLNRRMTLQANLTGKMERGAFAVERILRETVEGGEGDKERREFRMIDQFEMEGFLLCRLGARHKER